MLNLKPWQPPPPAHITLKKMYGTDNPKIDPAYRAIDFRPPVRGDLCIPMTDGSVDEWRSNLPGIHPLIIVVKVHRVVFTFIGRRIVQSGEWYLTEASNPEYLCRAGEATTAARNVYERTIEE